LAAAAAEAKPSITMFGNEGGVSCSNAWKPQFQQASESYIRGLWSGMNLIAASTEWHTQARTITLEDVKSSCAKDPHGLLGNVAERVYYRLLRLRHFAAAPTGSVRSNGASASRTLTP
jgi:hypothetical protein